MRDNENYWKRLRRRPVSRRGFLVGSGVAAAGGAAILAGCGDDDDDDEPTAAPATATATVAATATATAAPAATPTAAPTAAADAPRRGGTLRIWKTTEDAGLDPAIFHVNNTEIIIPTMTQPFTYQPQKNLISMDGMVSFEQVDPLTVVYNVRPGMKFHNGDPVTSESVVFSWRRLDDLYNAHGATHTTNTGWLFVDSFDAPDDLTVTESWKQPNADGAIFRSRHYYSFLNPRIVESEGTVEGTLENEDGTSREVLGVQNLPFGSGSGPYTLTQRNATTVRLERWADYHKHTPADDGFVEDGPYIDVRETRIIPDAAARKAAFLAGELDVYDDVDPLELPDFEGNDNVNILELPAGGYAHVGMDGGKFHDKRSRQALQKAFDYEGFIAALRPFGGNYQGPVSNLIPQYALSQEEIKSYYYYDPAEARALWAAADFEYPVDHITVFMGAGNPLQLEIGQFVAQSIGDSLGIETDTEAVDVTTWAARALERADVKDWELLAYGLGTSGGTTGIPNDSNLIHYDPRGYGNSAFNHHQDVVRQEILDDGAVLIGMLNAQEAELDTEARAGLLSEIQHWILERHWCNWSLPPSTVSYYGFSSRLRDYEPNEWLNFYANRRESMWLADA